MADSPPEVTIDADTGTSRRRSGRVVSKPEKFQPVVTTQKRKRGNRPQHEDSDGASQNEEDDSEPLDTDEQSGDEDADEEELKERRRKRRATAATTKRSATDAQRDVKRSKPITKQKATSLAIRPAKPSKSKARTGVTQPAVEADGSEPEGLYAELFTEHLDLDDVVEKWIDAFKEHESSAVANLFNMVLRATGCRITITHFDVEDPDHFSDRLADIQEEFQATKPTEYPLIVKGKSGTTFRQILTGFLEHLVEKLAAAKLLYSEPTLMEIVTSWVGSLSSAGNRPFRHTATVVALSITTGLCHVAKEIVERENKLQRQIKGEEKSKRVNKGRVAELKKQSAQGKTQQETIDKYLTEWFDTVYVHRYRDVDQNNRIDCARALGNWINIYSERFFESSYLRYLGWIMSDTAPATRLEVIRALNRLYRDNDKLSGLRNFTERFRPRMVEMATRDHDVGVRVAALDLLDILREAGFLEPDDTDKIGRLIFDSESRIRKTVVDFFVASVDDLYNGRLEDLGGDEFAEEVFGNDEGKSSDFERPRLSWLKLKCLAEQLQHYDALDELEPNGAHGVAQSDHQLLVTGGLESRFTMAADVLCHNMPELQDWEVISGYLLYDHSRIPQQNGVASNADTRFKQECRLSEKEEFLLLEVLDVAVRRDLSHTAEAGTHIKPTTKKPTKKARQETDDAQASAARHLTQLIPRLLSKFGSVPDATLAILKLEQVLNLDVFQELRQDTAAYSKMLDDIKKQFSTHSQARIVEEASRALLHAKSNEELEEITEEKLQSLWKSTIGAFTKIAASFDVQKRGALSVKALDTVSSTVLRLLKLSEISDPVEFLDVTASPGSKSKKTTSPMSNIDTLISMVNRGSPVANLDDDINRAEDGLVINTANLCLQYFMWKISILRQEISSQGRPTSTKLDHLQDSRQAFVDNLVSVIRSKSAFDELRAVLTGILIDVHVAFSGLANMKSTQPSSNSRDAAELAGLSQEIPVSVQALIVSVLTATEKAYAKQTKKKLEDVAEDDEPANEDDEPEPDDSDSEDGDEDAAEQSEAQREHRLAQSLIMERTLCSLAGRLVLGLLAGVLDGKQTIKKAKTSIGGEVGAVEKALRRNVKHLGSNFKAVVAEFDTHKAGSTKRKTATNTNITKIPGKTAQLPIAATEAAPTNKGVKAAPKSKEIIIEDDEESSDVSDEDNENEESRDRQIAAEEEEARRLAEEDAEMEDAPNGDGADEDADSVVGD